MAPGSRIQLRLSPWLLPALTLCFVSCAEAPAPAPSSPRPTAPALHRGPLPDYLSAAGLRWLVRVKPQQILREPLLEEAVRQVVPSARLDAFAESSGVDLRQISEAAIAGFPYATFYLAEVSRGSAALARVRFGERLLSGAVTKRRHPGLVRMTGIVGQTPETLLTIDERVLAVSVGDPGPAKIAEAYAEQRLKHAATAMHGAALSTLPDLYASNVAVLLAPGPFADDWQRAAAGLLQSTVALAIAVRPTANGKLATTICLSGAWQASAERAARRLEDAWRSLAQSSAGHLFELNEVARVSSSPDLLTLNVELDTAGLVRGLRASVFADLAQILDPPRSPRTTRDPDSLRPEP